MLTSVRRPQPQVTGISPKEGLPGTKVTIRGENLGVDARDLIALRICGVDCLLQAEWKSTNKIIARTGQAKGTGEIVVVTRSGGVGNSTVTFRGYNIQIGPLQDSAVWIDESQTFQALFNRNQAQSPLILQDYDDPLGISDEANDTKFPEDELAKLFPDGSGNTSQENFVASWYLLENHHKTSFDDLKSGLSYLKRRVSQHGEGPQSFVKANLVTFIDCYDTLTNMHEKLTQDMAASGKAGLTQPLEENLDDANKAAVDLFKDVLGRKDRADATRNALGVLHRFKFLFYLPCTMDANIKKGDYDLVITDYTRAKSLFGDADVTVFQKVIARVYGHDYYTDFRNSPVYQEVENRIIAFRDMLEKKLLQLPSSVEEQKKLIRYLLHLESPGDPAWSCLINMHAWLLDLIKKCTKDHVRKEDESSRDKSVHNPLSPTLPSAQVSRTLSFKSGSKVPTRILFIETCTRLLCENVPDFWRLGTAYISGKLAKVKKASRIEGAKSIEFKKMVLEIMQLYCNVVRAAFLPVSLENMPTHERDILGLWPPPDPRKDSPVSWLPVCVRHVRACMQSLSMLELTPDSMGLLQDLTFDLRWNSMSTLLKQAIEDIECLHTRETWSVDTDDERGGTTLLPTLFENMVCEVVQHVQEVIHTRQGENQLFSQEEIEEEAVQLCSELLESFADTLEKLATMGNPQQQPKPVKNRRSVLSNELFSPSTMEGMPSLDKRLIIMMSNCKQTLTHILPRLVELLEKHGYPSVDSVQQRATQCYEALDERLFDHYIEEKANPIMGVLEQHMYAGKLDWSKCAQPSDVQSYIKEAIMGLIEVHAEVYAINPHFVHRVMCRIVEATADEISRLLLCVTYNKAGALQARLDVAAFEGAVTVYTNNGTREAIAEALQHVPRTQDAKERRLSDDLLAKFNTKLSFQLACFKTESIHTNFVTV